MRNAATDLDYGAGGAAESGGRENPRERGADTVQAAGDVVAKLVSEEDGEKGEGKRPAEQETAGLLNQPRPRPEISIGDHGCGTIQKILHEARAYASGGNDAGRQEQDRDAEFEPGRGVGNLKSNYARQRLREWFRRGCGCRGRRGHGRRDRRLFRGLDYLSQFGDSAI